MKIYQRSNRLYEGRSLTGPGLTMGQKIKTALGGAIRRWNDDSQLQGLKTALIFILLVLAYVLAGTMDYRSGLR